jgi:uncharacterized membrane protein
MNLVLLFSSIPKELATLLIAMLPIVELRLALPIALEIYHMSIWQAYIWSVLGNMIPLIFVVFLLEPLSNFLSHHFYFFNQFFSWLFERTRRKHSRKFEIFEEFALVIFVAIPLPLTGGWTGTVAAFVFGIPPKKSLPLIFLGVLIAGVVVTILTKGVGIIF